MRQARPLLIDATSEERLFLGEAAPEVGGALLVYAALREPRTP